MKASQVLSHPVSPVVVINLLLFSQGFCSGLSVGSRGAQSVICSDSRVLLQSTRQLSICEAILPSQACHVQLLAVHEQRMFPERAMWHPYPDAAAALAGILAVSFRQTFCCALP